jgi:DNA replication ATP-dependent helicase Dna2
MYLLLTKAGDLMKDWRRLNVAITRARVKLIIVGSKSTLSTVKVFEGLFALLEANNWILTLPKDADKSHRSLENVPFALSQLSQSPL